MHGRSGFSTVVGCGPSSSTGIGINRGFQLAVQEINAEIELGDTLLWWVAVGYDSPNMIAQAVKNAGAEPEQIVGYLNRLNGYPGVFGDISFTPERHDGYPDEGIVMVEANSPKNGAFKLAPGYSA